MTTEGDVHEGRSPESFAAAATDAVRQYETQHGSDDLVTFKVEEMYVRAKHNPIHEYIVYLRVGETP
jgi:flavin-binding protein dodecin